MQGQPQPQDARSRWPIRVPSCSGFYLYSNVPSHIVTRVIAGSPGPPCPVRGPPPRVRAALPVKIVGTFSPGEGWTGTLWGEDRPPKAPPHASAQSFVGSACPLLDPQANAENKKARFCLETETTITVVFRTTVSQAPWSKPATRHDSREGVPWEPGPDGSGGGRDPPAL